MNHYAPYGEVWGEQGTVQAPFGFTGEPTDQNALVQLRARYYNPTLGVFPNLDPVEGDMAQPASLNRYSYVQNNPVNFVDKSGRIRETPNSMSCQGKPLCNRDAPAWGNPSQPTRSGLRFNSSFEYDLFDIAARYSRNYSIGVEPSDPNNPCATLVASVYGELGLIDAPQSCQGTWTLRDQLLLLPHQTSNLVKAHAEALYIEPSKRRKGATALDDAGVNKQGILPGDVIFHVDETPDPYEFGVYPHVVLVVGWGTAQWPSGQDNWQLEWENKTYEVYSTYNDAVSNCVEDPVPYVIDRGFWEHLPVGFSGEYYGQDDPRRGPRPYFYWPGVNGYTSTTAYEFWSFQLEALLSQA